MTPLLPSPPKIENIACMFNLNRYFAAKNNLVGQSISIDEHLKYMSNGKMIKPSHSAYDKINVIIALVGIRQARVEKKKSRP